MVSELDFFAAYQQQLVHARENDRGFLVFEHFLDERGSHPEESKDYECAFAAEHIVSARPANILDIGSHRLFVLGLLGGYPVSSVDVRARQATFEGEKVVTSDAKLLDLPDSSFDLVLSLCALEHFGLGRYGDPFDLDGDLKAFGEMRRVLRQGGSLVFTTTVSRAEHPSIAFNAHRIYSLGMLHDMCEGLELVDERFYSVRMWRVCSYDQVTDVGGQEDVYMGSWRKPPADEAVAE